MLQKGVCGFCSNLKKFSKWRKACVCTHLGQWGFLRCLHFLLQEQRLIEYSSLLLFLSHLHLKSKSMNCFPMKQPFLPHEPASPVLLANAWCNHTWAFPLHAGASTQITASTWAGVLLTASSVTNPFIILHFRGSLVYALSALRHYCTEHCNYLGSSLQFELFLPFVRGLRQFFFFSLLN